MSLLGSFAGALAETAVRAEAKNLVAAWIAAGYIEPGKEAELEAGLVDFTEVILGMMAKGQAAQLAQTPASAGARAK